jgi:hypothetical protein
MQAPSGLPSRSYQPQFVALASISGTEYLSAEILIQNFGGKF